MKMMLSLNITEGAITIFMRRDDELFLIQLDLRAGRSGDIYECPRSCLLSGQVPDYLGEIHCKCITLAF